MLQMGFSLTTKQIIEPLKNYRLVIGALLVNFALVPFVAYLVLLVIPLEQGLAIGLALLATAAGAPFLPKLAAVSKGDQAFSVGLMVLLMGVTVIYVPIVLPLILGPGVSINPLSIASSLIILMIIPLVLALFTRARYKSIADALRPHMAHASSLALILVTVLMLILNWEYIVSVIGTGAILALIIFVVASLGMGLLAAGKDKKRRSVLGLGTAQRNIAAALLVAGQNFADQPNVMIMILVGALVTLAILFPVAGELGRRGKKTTTSSK
ncbi:bile acid:sodium symporter family protein [Candidatus Bathyarchaeota archaeon]|nr:bile acid:sodium symporter family protein [Candidatus Bathyarchaeota archaeon]